MAEPVEKIVEGDSQYEHLLQKWAEAGRPSWIMDLNRNNYRAMKLTSDRLEFWRYTDQSLYDQTSFGRR